MKNKKILVMFALLIMSFVVCISNFVYAETMSDNFKKILTDGKLLINSVEPKSIDEAYIIIGEYIDAKYPNFYADISTLDKDYLHCDIVYNDEKTQETHNVEIVYNYDKKIKSSVGKYLKQIPENIEYFNVRDMEVINYWINSNEVNNLINYSDEFKKYLNYKNFNTEIRMGDDEEFQTFAAGSASFNYNNTTYGVINYIGTNAKHIIYVPEDTAITKDAIIKAVKERLYKYIGSNLIEIVAGDKKLSEYLSDYYDNNINDAQAKLDAEYAKPESERNRSEILRYENQVLEWKKFKEEFFNEYNAENGKNNFLKNALGDYYFVMKINGVEHKFIVQKGSTENIANPTYKTSDVATDIEIITSTANIPLDTIINAKKLTDGTEYDKILKVIDAKEADVYDLKLYSKSIADYITELSDGKFEVRIPLDEKYEGKKLVVYYVDSNDKITEHKVTVKDGYAIFTTNHFSVYALTEQVENLPSGEKSGEKDDTPKTGVVTSSGVVTVIGTVSLASFMLLKARKED